LPQPSWAVADRVPRIYHVQWCWWLSWLVECYQGHPIGAQVHRSMHQGW